MREMQLLVWKFLFSFIPWLLYRSLGVDGTEIERCSFKPHDCQDLQDIGFTESGVYYVTAQGTRGDIKVYCDMVTDGGGWLVFQRRLNGSVDFYKNWKEYEHGFGDPSGEFWLGNIFLHILTSQARYQLRVDLVDWNGETRHAQYKLFNIGDTLEKYRLLVAGYTGNAGDAFTSHNGRKFTTKDSDNDMYEPKNCAEVFHGAWWYHSCTLANLNGFYQQNHSLSTSIHWHPWKETTSIKATEMKIKSL